MTTYLNLNNDTESLKTKNKHDEIKDLLHKTEKYDFENIKIDNEYYKQKIKV